MKCEVCTYKKIGKFYHRLSDNKIVCFDCYWKQIHNEVEKAVIQNEHTKRY